MANISDFLKGEVTGIERIGAYNNQRHFVLNNVYDARKVSAAQNDVIQLIQIPERVFVDNLRWEVSRVEGAAVTFGIGDAGNTTQYGTALSANALAQGVSARTASELYGSEDILSLVAESAAGLAECQIVLMANVVDFGNVAVLS